MARTVGGLEELADAIEAAGGPTPTLVPLSLTDDAGLQRLCLAIHERWGRLDLGAALRRQRRAAQPRRRISPTRTSTRPSRSTSAAPAG